VNALGLQAYDRHYKKGLRAVFSLGSGAAPLGLSDAPLGLSTMDPIIHHLEV